MTIDEINNATEKELTNFPGVGPGIAGRIEKNKPFKHWSDVKEVAYVEDWILEELKEKEKRPTNPNGANRNNPDPRQSKFIANFLNPESETYSNAKASALRAGYSKAYAKEITGRMPSWLEESVENSELVEKAMRNLLEFLDEDDDKRLKWKASEFTLERLQKEKFGKNVDVTSGGDKIQPELSEKQREELIEEIKEENSK